jgi:hypothetical protein
MSGYQRFLPRDGTRTTAHAVAEAAEVKAIQGLRDAEALLKPAEVRPRVHQLQQASAEVQQQQSRRFPELQQVQQLQQAPGPPIAEVQDRDAASQTQPSLQRFHHEVPHPGIPAQWCEGVLRLSIMPPPRTYPAQAWQQLISDAEQFLHHWAAQAHRLGWQD